MSKKKPDNNSDDNRLKGYIALFRSLQDHWLYPSDREFTEYEAWIDLLLEANHKSRSVRIKNKIIQCNRGESVRSLTQWAKRWKWSKSKAYRFLELLESDGMVETVSETVTTRITICNYESYQTPKEKNETQMEQGRNDPETNLKRFGTESDPNKNENNANNENKKKNERESGGPPDFSSVEGYFLKEGGKPESADRFYQKHSATGWKLKGDPIVNWESLADSWIDIDKRDQGNNGLTDANKFRGAFNEEDYTGVANAQAYTNKLDGYSKPFNPEKAKQYYMTDEERKKANSQIYDGNDLDDFKFNEGAEELRKKSNGVLDGGTW